MRLGRGKRRSLLALLLLHANKVVSQDRLIDALWGERPPAAPRTAVQVLVSELRKELGQERVVTAAAGYVLRVEPAEIDAMEFARLLAAGEQALKAGDAERAEERLREALALWRGSPLQDFVYEDFAQAEIRRLEELRLQAEEELVEAELARGRGPELVPRLEALIAAHPLHERLRGQLMLALYRAQRQADALAAYRDARAMLLDELGVEPSRALQRLHQAILNQDPALEAAAPELRTAMPPTRRSRRRVLVAGLVAASLLAAVALVIVLRGGGSAPTPVVAVPRRSVVAIDGASGRLLTAVALEPQPLATPIDPRDVVVGYGSVWVADAGQQAILRIDPAKRAVVGTIGVGADVQALALGFGSLWVADGNSATVTRIDPHNERVVATIPLGRSGLTPNTTFAIAAGAGSVWASGGDSLVERIDPKTDRVVERILVGDPRALTANGRFVWCGTRTGEIVRIVPGTGRSRVRRFARVENGVVAITVSGNRLWVIVPSPSFELWGYDTRTAKLVSTLVAGQLAVDVVGGRGDVWVPLYREGELIDVDATRNAIVRRVVVRPGVGAVALGEGALWAVVR